MCLGVQWYNPDMRKRLQLVLMASTIAATSLFSAVVHCHAQISQSSESITATDDHGRMIYTNDFVSPVRAQSSEPPTPQRALMYWSSKENRWKPVPSANTASMKAARSAAAEVNQYLGRGSERAAATTVPSANANSTSIEAAIEEAAARHNVDPNLVRAVVKVESNFNPNAVSRKGAMGLMQLMPSTARELKVQNPFDPEQNVDAGVRHLKQLLENYGGNIKLTLAAYNAGAGAVARSSGVPRYAETQQYVRKITNLYYAGSHNYAGSHFDPTASHDSLKMQRDDRGLLYVSNTD
jgi:soluble lytic murein transglycosylase-like protein